jgi:hypothetical protein
MVEGELSLIRYNLVNFFSVLLYSRPLYPTSTLLIKIIEALLSSESDPDKKLRERVDWIYENTHEKVNEPLSIIEYVVFTNIQKSFNLNRTVEIKGKEFYLIELYKYLNQIEKELAQIAIKIAKKYSFEIPVSGMMGGVRQSGDNQSISI